jgi:phosphatidate cytidylyltransferase
MIAMERTTTQLIGGVAGLLVVASLIGLVLHWRAGEQHARLTVQNLNARIRAWWVMAAAFGLAIWAGPGGACVLFAIISFLALREMLTLAPTRRADHRTLFWVFFVLVPLQYYLIYIRWYGLYSILIPVYAFLFLAVRSTLTGDYTNYLERTAKIQWGAMICIYCISHAPALLMLDLHGLQRPWMLLVYLVLIVQLSDVLQYVWGSCWAAIRSRRTSVRTRRGKASLAA